MKVDLLKREILTHKFVYIFLSVILIGALFVRVYRIDQILQFYFDQGRDGLAIWDLIYNHNVSLIGPTTGIAGIFRGPFYYWLITPAYFLGGGNPIFPSVFLSILGVFAILLIYYLGAKIQNRTTGLIAAIIASFSFYLMLAGRWLSNPTPMLLLSLLLVWMMLLAHEGKKWAWIAIALLAGTSLFHFGSSGEFFYFPAIVIFFVWQFFRKNSPNIKIILISIGIFLLTASPLIIFDLRHDNILSNNIYQFLFTKESFKSSFTEVLAKRLDLYKGVFLHKIFLTINSTETALLLFAAVSFIALLPKFVKNTGVMILVLMLATVTVGMLFFQGNEGNVYEYYFTGYFLIFVLLLSVVLGKLWQFLPGKIFVFVFMYVFLTQNLEVVRNYIIAGVDGPTTIAFGNQNQAIDWIYQDAGDQKFNVDVYVPPVIPHAYDYLLKWRQNDNNSPEMVPLLYTLYEVDPPHPERLQAWMDRQKGIGNVEEEATFGGITVQRRTRI